MYNNLNQFINWLRAYQMALLIITGFILISAAGILIVVHAHQQPPLVAATPSPISGYPGTPPPRNDVETNTTPGLVYNSSTPALHYTSPVATKYDFTLDMGDYNQGFKENSPFQEQEADLNFDIGNALSPLGTMTSDDAAYTLCYYCSNYTVWVALYPSQNYDPKALGWDLSTYSHITALGHDAIVSPVTAAETSNSVKYVSQRIIVYIDQEEFVFDLTIGTGSPDPVKNQGILPLFQSFLDNFHLTGT